MSTSKTFEFDEEENPWQLGFYEDRLPVTGYTGGYGNGKTASLGIIAVTLARTYQDARILCGRATRPKLEDSTKPELLKWFPPDWVAKWPTDRHNNIVMRDTNSTIEFRHIRQEGKGKGEQQSNLLSATYDAILVDQLDDPEFTYKDFEDLIGRLRGTAKYIGDDPTMPKYGPQWFRFGANPTRNWLYREIAAPYFVYEKTGIIGSKLLLDYETRKPIVKIYNAPSSANKKHTGAQYVNRMRSVFRGANVRRFVEASWDAYEGLIYPEYESTVHIVQHDKLVQYIEDGIQRDALGVIEGYDFGQASPSCYLIAFYNDVGDVFVVDGYYQAMYSIKKQARHIKQIRNKYNVIPKEWPFADPDIFKKKSASGEIVGTAVAEMFRDEGIDFQRASNNVSGGIDKVSSYLAIDKLHRHPITKNYGAPRIFFSSNLEFLDNEISDYYWNKNIQGQNVDKPRDSNDHSMDALKYLLTKRPSVVGQLRKLPYKLPDEVFQWTEAPDQAERRILPRHM